VKTRFLSKIRAALNLIAVVGVPLDELWTEDGVFYDPNSGVRRGCDQGYSP
jgi:hypothetical protein